MQRVKLGCDVARSHRHFLEHLPAEPNTGSMRNVTKLNSKPLLFFLYQRTQSIHRSRPLHQWKPRDESNLSRSELLDRICRLLILRRHDAFSNLPFVFSDALVDGVLRKLRMHPEACLHFFQSASKQHNFKPHIKSYCKIVHILCRARMFDETRFYLNVVVGLCEGKNTTGFVIWDELVKVYREFSFSPTVFDMILKVFAKKGQTRNALHVFDNMGKYGRVPSLQSCNSLLSGLVKNCEFATVFDVYDQILRMGIVPDIFSYTIMVDAYCKDGRVCKALEFVDEMCGLGFEPNAVTYHCLINGYVRLGDEQGVQRVLEMMKQKGLQMNEVSYTLVIKSYCKLCKMDQAEKAFQDMKNLPSLTVDEHAYGVLIDGYCQNGGMDDALRLKDEMLGSGLKMNMFICNSMINGYCKLGKVHEARQLVKSMLIWNLKPDSYSFNTLVDGYCRKGLMAEAFKVCDKMIEECIEPTVVTYNTLLKGFCGNGATADAINLWQLMLKRGVALNEVSYGILLDGFLKMENVEGALMLWKHVLARGFATRITFDTMINGLHKMGKVNEAEEILNKMKELDSSLDGIRHKSVSARRCEAKHK